MLNEKNLYGVKTLTFIVVLNERDLARAVAPIVVMRLSLNPRTSNGLGAGFPPKSASVANISTILILELLLLILIPNKLLSTHKA